MPQQESDSAQPTLNTIARLNRDLEQLQNQINQLSLQRREIIERSTHLVGDLTQREIPVVVATPVRSARELRPGDRVRITNGISQIQSRPIQERDRLATVTRVSATRRIYITTDSGIETWRSARILHHSPRGLEENDREFFQDVRDQTE